MSVLRDQRLPRAPVSDEMERLLRSFGFDPFAPSRDEDSNVVTSHWMPAVDIEEEPEKFLILADVPGVSGANIEVSMAEGVLSIRGERPALSEEQRKSLRRSERPRGSFHRRFSLPETADAGRITARCTDGVLEVTIPKRDIATPRRIEVRS